jgi:predicted permease
MRFYRLLLKLYPARFRENHERELLLAFRDESGELPAWRLWPKVLLDLLLTLPARLAEEAAQDLRHSWRVHARRPLVALLTIAALALGMGVATGLFAVMNAMLWRSLPFQEPERLAVLRSYVGTGKFADSAALFHEWRRGNAYLKSSTLFITDNLNVSGGPRAVHTVVCETTADFFEVLGARPVWGRGFLREEETPGRNDAVVISHAMWNQTFGGDPAVLGRVLHISGTPFRVVGVAPVGFDYPAGAQVWTPTVFEFSRIRKEGVVFWQILGRLKDGLAFEQAREMYLAEIGRLDPKWMRKDEDNRAKLEPLRMELAGRARRSSFVLMGAVLCLLLIACGNVANLLLTRALDRRREMLIRSALGASRARLFQQLVFESLVLSLVAGLAGLAVSRMVSRALTVLQPRDLEAGLDWRVLLFAAAMSLATGLVFGVLPAWHMSRLQDSNESLRAGASQRGLTRLRQALIGVQVCLTLILLAGGMSLGRSFLTMVSADAGFVSEDVLTLRVSMQGTARESDARRQSYYQEALQRLRVLPGVTAAAGVNYLPLSVQPVGVTKWTSDSGQSSRETMTMIVTPGYFDVLRTPLLRGRDLKESDAETSGGVAVVNEEFARPFGGPDKVMGRVVRRSKDDQGRTIVGVVRSAQHFGPGSEMMAQIFVPLKQAKWPNLTFVLKTRAPMEGVAAAARAALVSVDPAVPVFGVQSLEQHRAERLAQPRLYTGALLFFGGFAALLALLGLYGVVSYSVAQRTPELGVRMALGATTRGLRAMVFRQSMLPLGLALLAGLAAAPVAGKLLAHLIYNARAASAGECLASALLLLGAAALAILIAARRIGRMDPAGVLRAE